ncbi:Uridine kinase [bioreactor metagenome]|uniref:Uridine kinase n=1 Tax=bioreactor metagenome TaxID=1076179 RepID=A0A644URD7_9ZZZZ|nr:nucleoside kinase [Negativicutes bacterium]
MSGEVFVSFANSEGRKYPDGITLLEISKDAQEFFDTPIVAARINNEIKNLESQVTANCRIEFLDLTTDEGNKIYQRSLAFVMVTAVQELFPDGEVTVEHSLGNGLYCELHLGRDVTPDDITKLEQQIQVIIKENRPITKRTLTIAEAISLFSTSGQLEKVKLLKQLNRDKVNIYYCGTAYDYMYGTMVPSTGFITLFGLAFYKPGFILRSPNKDNYAVLPPFNDQPKLAQIFREAERWGSILKCGYVSSLNDYASKNEIGNIIRIAEALHEKKIAQIADFVSEHRDAVRIILVAGPSSSGKTTFAQRLGIQLRVNGITPFPISLDDYFVDRDHTPRDEKGDYDFESIESIDLKLFNEHLTMLLNGEAVSIPTYNFRTGQREFNDKVIQIKSNQPLIIEGIHGLNERLTSAIPRDHKIKIYISALTQLSIDNHNRIPTTDTRLIRRIVRDSQFRGHDALRTLELWQSVRRGEERNIFPFQEEADIMFNSALIYELGVLKKYAEPLLRKVDVSQYQYSEAKRLLNFLGYFTSIDEGDIPKNSILREFIGESCF